MPDAALPLRRVMYISTARQPITPEECEAILRQSRRNNAKAQVTGLLVSGGRRFLQVLEGAPDAVEATLARIKGDPRHFAIVTLSDTWVAERAFSGWAMGHCPGAADANDPDTLAQLVAPIADPSLRAYFEGFAKLHLPPAE